MSTIDPLAAFGVFIGLGSLLYTLSKDRSEDQSELQQDIAENGKQIAIMQSNCDNNRITSDEKQILTELNIKMGLIWTAISKDLPMGLIKATTPRLDQLLLTINGDYANVSDKDVPEFLELLNQEYEQAKTEENDTRIVGLALVRDALKLEKGLIDPDTIKLVK